MAYTQIGVVVKPHGLKGAVVCLVEADYMEAFPGLKTLFVEQLGTKVPYAVQERAPLNADRYKVTLTGVSTQEAANALRGQNLFCPTKELPLKSTLDIEGFQIHTESAGLIGEVSQVLKSSTQVLLEVSDENQSWLIPFVEDFIVSIDPDQRVIILDLPEGLLDI